MVNETIEAMRDVATSFCFNFARETDKGLAIPKDPENPIADIPTEKWVMMLRESVTSWSLFSDDETVLEYLQRILETTDKPERDRRIQFLLNGTTKLLSSFPQSQIDEATKHLAWSLGWANRSTYLAESLAEDCGTEEHFYTMFTEASWTLFLYLFVTDHRTPE